MNSIKPTGKYCVSVYGPEGLKSSWEGPNVVTTVGKEFMASFLKSAALAAATFTAKYIAVGTGTGAEVVGDTGMGTELARHTGTVSYTSGGIYNVTATFPTGTAVGAVIEFGLFSTATGGTLLSRNVKAAAYNVTSADHIVVNYAMTLS
ncbi:MAG: hypothetical protein V4750_02735 [Pseudomonadota bacterium]